VAIARRGRSSSYRRVERNAGTFCRWRCDCGALNYKVIEIAQRNVNSGFTLAKSLAAAKNLPEVVEGTGCLLAQSVSALTVQAESTWLPTPLNRSRRI
jgi:hypothetical protein